MITAIDLFAGVGGFTLAAERAGVRVLWAANHWQHAVTAHSVNHPGTVHSCQDLHQAAWEEVPRMDLILASPACQGHSRARGVDRPHHDKTRSTAWAVVSCAEFHKPRAIIVENVPEFAQWALFPAWRLALEALGYALSVNVFDAADASVPQHRSRVFVVATRSKHPLAIAAPAGAHVAAESFIDFKAGSWSKVRKPGRAKPTVERYRDGRARGWERFIFSYYGNTRTARSILRPCGTITTRDRWAAVDGDRMRMFSVDECRAAMGFPLGYRLPADRRVAVHLLGNAVPPPLAEHVIREVKRAA